LLKGEERGRLRELAVAFAAEALVVLAGRDRDAAGAEVEGALDGGEAANRFARMIEAQGGDPRVVDDPWAVLPRAPVRRDVAAPGGYLAEVDAEALGRAAVSLGAGRVKKGDPIDPSVGIEFRPKVGDRLDDGEPLATVHAADQASADMAAELVLGAVTVVPGPVELPALLYGWHGTEVAG
jgi:thymidine phosphorylase